MTVGTPGVERKESSQYTKTDKGKREEPPLQFVRNMLTRNVKNVHACRSRIEIDTQYPDEQQGRTTHQHQGQLHGCIFFFTGAPNSDQQVQRDEGDLIKHKHGEEVGGDEKTEDTDTQQTKPHKVFPGQEFHLPRSEYAGEYDNGR